MIIQQCDQQLLLLATIKLYQRQQQHQNLHDQNRENNDPMQQRGNDDNKSHGKKRPLSSPSPCRVSVATRTRRSSKISKKKQKNNDNNNFASTIAEEDASKWRTTPLLFFIQTLGYLDNTSLIVLCQVCKQLCTIIQNGQGMATKLVRVFDLRPKFSIYGNSNRSRRFVTTMCPYSRNVALN